MEVQLRLESLDGNVDMNLRADTTAKVMGDMLVVDWQRHAKQWKHLHSIEFPEVGPSSGVDLLIDNDYADFHFSFQDIRGHHDEPLRQTHSSWLDMCQLITSKVNNL